MFTRAVAAAAALLIASASAANSKRGLVFTPNSTFPNDAYIWTAPPTSLTWYYNYEALPSQIFSNVSQADFEFVPMLWGAPSDINDKSFYNTIKDLIDERHVNITNILTFNEPDGPNVHGGSDMDPEVAAQVWVNNIVPLQEDYKALRIGLPACTGAPAGLEWTKKFLEACSGLMSENEKTKKNCTFDFVPIHWYGNFEGLASHMGEYSAAYVIPLSPFLPFSLSPRPRTNNFLTAQFSKQVHVGHRVQPRRCQPARDPSLLQNIGPIL